MIRFLVIFVFTVFLASPPGCANAQSQADIQIKIWEQAQPFLSDCSTYPDGSADAAACEQSRLLFVKEYYEALLGDAGAQFDMSYLFSQAAPPSAVIFSPTLGCAWLIVFDDSGGSPDAGPQEPAVAAGCRKVPEASLAAQGIEAEIANIKNTGSP